MMVSMTAHTKPGEKILRRKTPPAIPQSFLKDLRHCWSIVNHSAAAIGCKIAVIASTTVGDFIEPHAPGWTADKEVRAQERGPDRCGNGFGGGSYGHYVTLKQSYRLVKARIIPSVLVNRLPWVVFTKAAGHTQASNQPGVARRVLTWATGIAAPPPDGKPGLAPQANHAEL